MMVAQARLGDTADGAALDRGSMGHPPAQTSWSKALVRHGADLRAALAEVLGLAAEEIRVKDGPE